MYKHKDTSKDPNFRSNRNPRLHQPSKSTLPNTKETHRERKLPLMWVDGIAYIDVHSPIRTHQKIARRFFYCHCCRWRRRRHLSLSLKHAHTQKKALCFKLLFFLVCFSRKLKIQKPFLGFTIIFLELHNFGNFVPPFCSLLSSLNFWFNIYIFFFGETFFLSFYPANSVFFFFNN